MHNRRVKHKSDRRGLEETKKKAIDEQDKETLKI